MPSIIKLLNIYVPNPDVLGDETWSLKCTNSDQEVYFRPGVANITSVLEKDRYLPNQGMDEFSIALTSDLTPSNMDVELFNIGSLPDFILCNIHLYSEIKFQLYFWVQDGISLPTLFLAGKVGQVEVNSRSIKFTLVDKLSDLIKPRSRRYDTTCGHSFGDSICRVNIPSNSLAPAQTLTVTGGEPSLGYITVSGYTAPSPASLEAYKAGYIQINTPAYLSLYPIRWDIADFDGTNLYLWDMMLGVSSLTSIRLVAGCFGSLDDCKRYNNVINFGGFAHMISTSQYFSPTLNGFLTT
jgi:hypothetical protein